MDQPAAPAPIRQHPLITAGIVLTVANFILLPILGAFLGSLFAIIALQRIRSEPGRWSGGITARWIAGICAATTFLPAAAIFFYDDKPSLGLLAGGYATFVCLMAFRGLGAKRAAGAAALTVGTTAGVLIAVTLVILLFVTMFRAVGGAIGDALSDAFSGIGGGCSF